MARTCLTCIACFLVAGEALAGGPKVDVVGRADAPELEHFAARELAAQFQQLFEAQVTIRYKLPASAEHLILLGSPETNPAIKNVAAASWPKLTDQGHLLRSIEKDGTKALLVGGGS